MSKFDKPYTKSEINYSALLFDILQDACSVCGVILNTQRFLNYDYVVQNRPEDEKTSFREIVSYVSQLAACFARINYNGTLDLSWYNYSKFESENAEFANITRVKSYEVAANDIRISGVQIIPINSEQIPYLSGEEGYIISVEGNPLSQDNIENLAYSLRQKLNGFIFRPFETSALSNPAIEAGDICKITDQKGNSYQSFISSISYTFGSFETYKADAETPNKKESTRYSASTKAIQAAKKETEKQISIYDLSVQQMNNLMANAMGTFETIEFFDKNCINPH